MKKIFVLLVLTVFGYSLFAQIDRHAVVSRHNVALAAVDTLGSLTVGNGRFAMTVDVTGLQTFPEEYQHGVPLGTQSEWGWHSFPNTENYQMEESLVPIAAQGRMVPYARQISGDGRAARAANFLRQNPHRIHLALLGWVILDKNGYEVALKDIQKIDQKLDLWTGEIHSKFLAEGELVEVITLASPTEDEIAISVKSKLLKEGRLYLKNRFPYPTDKWADMGVNFDVKERQRLTLIDGSKVMAIERKMDNISYFTQLFSDNSKIKTEWHQAYILIKPLTKKDEWSFVYGFSQKEVLTKTTFQKLHSINLTAWESFWNSGGIIDFGKVKDPRAKELERRMVLSMYLTKINCGGETPPQETGLTYNSWYGKPHLEMTWWHGTHFPLWGRPEILEGHLSWYLRNQKSAEEIAKRQGFEGIRWPKMTDPWGGETASSVGSYLIWQQPHPIYFAELLYRSKPTLETLDKYATMIERTAEFMASYAYYDTDKGTYILGPGLIPAQESHSAATTINPTYELAYWRWALETAQKWRERMGKKRVKEWDEVIAGLSPLPKANGVYLAAESAPDSYTNEKYLIDHPSVFATYGVLPATAGFEPAIMNKTYDLIMDQWTWGHTWGWDFPMTAMTATRLGRPEDAVNALLMNQTTNTYLVNGHNYQDGRLTLYLPGNGGFLTALAMMTAGYDGDEQKKPGLPANWDVQWEGLQKMP